MSVLESEKELGGLDLEEEEGHRILEKLNEAVKVSRGQLAKMSLQTTFRFL